MNHGMWWNAETGTYDSKDLSLAETCGWKLYLKFFVAVLYMDIDTCA